jgi:Mn2+/Fe2+ NRAMP family transporter
MVVMLADTDAGNVVTAAQGGAIWRYALLPLVLALIPALYFVQELTVRLGVFTGKGFGALVREHFGPAAACLCAATVAVAAAGSLVTEFSAVAGIGQLYGVPREAALGMAAAILIGAALSGSYLRVERIALAIGLFECAFFAVAWSAHPDLRSLAGDAIHMPFTDRGFLYLAAAIVGATFNPWMVFYQQSAVAQKRLQPSDYGLARLDTAAGAAVTQLLTGAVLVAAAATVGVGGHGAGLSSVGEISDAFSPLLGETMGKLVFSAGVLGAAMVAAIVASLALSWGLGEAAGISRSGPGVPMEGRAFNLGYAALILATAATVEWARDLVGLNIAAQVLNVFLLPVVLGFLVALATKALADRRRPRGWALTGLVVLCGAVCLLGIVGGLAGLFLS